MPLFHGYLKSEFSEENLDFLMSVKEFRQFPNKEKAAEIYELFVRINSLKEVRHPTADTNKLYGIYFKLECILWQYCNFKIFNVLTYFSL